jgi:hypothetical protein
MEIKELRNDRIVIDCSLTSLSKCEIVRYGFLDFGRELSRDGMYLEFGIVASFWIL